LSPNKSTSTGNLNSDGRRRSSVRSINIPNIRISDVEAGAIANRRISGRRSSRHSQIPSNHIVIVDNLFLVKIIV
jgi:hypothetical protein